MISLYDIESDAGRAIWEWRDRVPRKSMETLTESMFYVLMVLAQGPLCGTEIAGAIEKRTRGRLRVGPATLYTILAKFEGEKYIREVAVEGRRRTYEITGAGSGAYAAELWRLRRCVADAEKEASTR